MKTHSWDRPTPEQAKEGILAIHIAHHSYFKDGVRKEYDSPCPYREATLLRRLARGGEMPYWITPILPKIDY